MDGQTPYNHTPHVSLDSQMVHTQAKKKANITADIDAIDMRDLRFEILKQ
jgi:hypothetical protein